MKRLPFLAALGLALALCAHMPAATPPKAGAYEIATLTPTGGTVYCLVKITPKDNGMEGELIAAHPQLRSLDLKDVTLDGDTLRVVLKGPVGDMTFEGRVPKDGADTVLGTFETSGRLFPARLAHTEKTELTLASATVRRDLPEPMRKAMTLSSKSLPVRARARRTQDADEKAKLLKEADEADKEARAEVPKLYREVVEKHADGPAATLAAQNLLRQ